MRRTNRLRTLLSLALTAGVLLMAACGPAEGGSSSGEGAGGSGSGANPTAAGRYVETDITPEGMDGLPYSHVLEDGTLVCFSEDMARRWDSADGGDTWTESKGPGAEDERFKEPHDVSMAPDGTLYVSFGKPVEDGNGGTCRFLRIAPDGTANPLVITEFDNMQSNPVVYSMQAFAGDRLVLNFGSGGGAVSAEEGEDEPEGSASPSPAGEGEAESTPAPENDAGEGDESALSAPESTLDSKPEEGAEPTAEAPAASGVEDEDDGGMAFNTMNEMHSGLYDGATGAELADLTDWLGHSTATDGKTLYTLGYDRTVKARSLSDGNTLPDTGMAFSLDDMMFGVPMAVDKDGALYAADNKRIQKIPAGSKAAEILMDGSSYSFGDPMLQMVSLSTLPDGSLILGMMHGEDMSSRLYRYRWDENATLDPTKTLNIWALEDSPVLRAAISEYRRKNPGVTVQLEVIKGGDAELDTADAIQNLNTRLLAGDGPDLLMLDGLPWESYAEKGMLADLSEKVNTGGLFSQLLAPYKTDEGVFAVPTRFRLPLLTGEKGALDAVNTLDDLLAKVQAAPGSDIPNEDTDLFAELPENERPALSFSGLREAFDMLWNAGAPSVVKDGAIDAGTLGKLLDALKVMADRYTLTNMGEDTPGAVMAMSSGGSAISEVTGSSLAYVTGRATYGAFTAGDMQMINYLQQQPGSTLKSLPGLAEGTWVPQTLMGITADSQVQDLAADFLNTLLSDEVQSVRLTDGFPVTTTGMDQQIAGYDEMLRTYSDSGEGFSFHYAPLLESLKTPLQADATLTDRVYEAAEAFCKGELDREGAVAKVEQDLKNYLAERQ